MELNDIIWRGFYQQVDYLGYHAHKLLAVDGTFLNLPYHESIRKELGYYHNQGSAGWRL